MAISSRLFCLLSVCIVGVWCTTNNTLFAPENATLITEVGRSVSILWEKRGPRPKEDILIQKGHQGTLARFAIGHPKKDEQGRVDVEIIGSVDTQFGIRMGNVKLDDSGSYFVQIEGSEMMAEAVLVVLGKPKKAEVNVSEGWACCSAESVTKPAKFRPPMMYSWNLISSEDENPINVNVTCVNITHEIQAASCHGLEEGGNLSSPISSWVTTNKDIRTEATVNVRTEKQHLSTDMAVTKETGEAGYIKLHLSQSAMITILVIVLLVSAVCITWLVTKRYNNSRDRVQPEPEPQQDVEIEETLELTEPVQEEIGLLEGDDQLDTHEPEMNELDDYEGLTGATILVRHSYDQVYNVIHDSDLDTDPSGSASDTTDGDNDSDVDAADGSSNSSVKKNVVEHQSTEEEISYDDTIVVNEL